MNTSTSSHNHEWANYSSTTTTWRSFTTTGANVTVQDWNNDGLDAGGTNSAFPLGTGGASMNLYTDDDSHNHSVSIGATSTGSQAAHNHTCNPAANTSGNADTSQVMPYLQLLVCRKD